MLFEWALQDYGFPLNEFDINVIDVQENYWKWSICWLLYKQSLLPLEPSNFRGNAALFKHKGFSLYIYELKMDSKEPTICFTLLFWKKLPFSMLLVVNMIDQEGGNDNYGIKSRHNLNMRTWRSSSMTIKLNNGNELYSL